MDKNEFLNENLNLILDIVLGDKAKDLDIDKKLDVVYVLRTVFESGELVGKKSLSYDMKRELANMEKLDVETQRRNDAFLEKLRKKYEVEQPDE